MPQGPTNPTSHVSVSALVLTEDLMAQITETCYLVLHVVALVNAIYSVQQVFQQTFRNTTDVRTLPNVLLELSGLKNTIISFL